MRNKVRSVDREIAQIAERQQGAITHRQLLDAGLSRAAVWRRVERGLLHREFRGVYRVGHKAPSTEARYMAAVLACGQGAVLSGLAAAFLFGLVKGAPPQPEVTTVGDRQVRGVITRRVRDLPARDISVYRDIPITTVPRTLVDIAGRLSFADLGWACHQADVRYGVGKRRVLAVLSRRPRVRGAGKLREVYGDQGITLSKLERAFLGLLKAEKLPLPTTNRNTGGRYVDCRWSESKLTVGLDSYTYHHTRHAWEQDYRRERKARARGDEFRRYNYGDVIEAQTYMLAELRDLLP